MCAIAGIFDLEGTREIDVTVLQRMNDAQIHRGPDGEGLWHAPGIGLAHRRLAIIDLAGGAQPFHSLSRSGVLTFNGEIYNHTELSTQLKERSVQLRTKSDTEVVAEGISIYGPDYLHQLNGMFAFGFWDQSDQRLILARDRLGEKPLYYGVSQDGYLLFASEIGALIASGKFTTMLNSEAVADYLQLGYVPDPKSIFSDIHKLPPAHFLIAERHQNLRLREWWSVSFSTDKTLDYATATQTLQQKLDDAVSRQMIADVPLGAFLSGGADSSAIVSSMAKARPQPPVTCTIGFEQAPSDERPHAREISDLYQTDHHESVVQIDLEGLIDPVAKAYGEPFADTSALPTYLVSKLARNHVTVALSGDGGDELFAGYRRYPFFLGEEKIRGPLPDNIRALIFGTAGKAYPKLDGLPRPLRLKTTLQALGETSAAAYTRAASILLPETAQHLMAADFTHSLAAYTPSGHFTELMNTADTNDALSKALYVDMKTWLAGRMLVKVDRASMAHSLEVRPPLLDYTLVEWAARLPSTFKLTGNTRKRILRDAIRGRLPEGFLDRPKRGFELPFGDWMRAANSPVQARLRDSSAWKNTGLIDEQAVINLMDEHQRGRKNNAQALWSIMMFDAFLRVHNIT